MTESNPTPGKRSFVFQDPHGKRWPRLRGVLVLVGMIMALRHYLVLPDAFHPSGIAPARIREFAERADPRGDSEHRAERPWRAQLAEAV
jgi:hypothetical protein